MRAPARSDTIVQVFKAGLLNPALEHLNRKFDSARQIELAVDGGQMLLHRFFAYPKFGGYLPVSETTGHGPGHLVFAIRERFHVHFEGVRHGFLLRLGAQLPAYIPKRGSLEKRTPPTALGKTALGNAAPADPSATASLVLLERIRQGDSSALNRLMDRYLPRLSRWASGRLPQWARDLSDTQDIVQDTLIRSVANLDHFEARGEGALQAYLRGAVMNRIRDEIRRRRRTPSISPLESTIPGSGQSPLEQAIGAEVLAKYDAALERLDPETREAVIARVEMGCSYAEIAEVMNKPSADAARMTVSRALVKLAEEMRHG
jgi:RNA polymerase sigma-70 factor (ECF subfamily)